MKNRSLLPVAKFAAFFTLAWICASATTPRGEHTFGDEVDGTASDDNAPSASPRLPIPDEEAEKEATTVIKDVYKTDYDKAKTQTQKLELANKLLKEGVQTEGDATGKFVLMRIARDLAAQAGDVSATLDAIDSIATAFEIDPLEMKLGALTKMSKTVTATTGKNELVQALEQLAEDAANKDNFPLAQQVAGLAITVSRNAKDGSLLRNAVAQNKKIEQSAIVFAAAQKALKLLDEKPTDPDANLVVGKFQCFYRKDWGNGLSHLALGSDGKSKDLAAKDVASPTIPIEQVALGDGWWAAAEKETGAAKVNVQSRAAYWYEKALPKLSGLPKAKAEKRLADLAHADRQKKKSQSQNTWTQISGRYRTDHPRHQKLGDLVLETGADDNPIMRRVKDGTNGEKTLRAKQVGARWIFDWGNVDLFAITPQPDKSLLLSIFWKDCGDAFDKSAIPKRAPDETVRFVSLKHAETGKAARRNVSKTTAITIFDGKTLAGWDGNPKFWRVENGAIVGQTTRELPTDHNTCCVWLGGELGDFVLTAEFKIEGGNSGIQYRSKAFPDWVVRGYQADFDGRGDSTGTLYEEGGRGVLAKRGSKVIVHSDGKKEESNISEDKDIVDSLKKGEWNEYEISAIGNHMVQKINGTTTIDLTDDQEGARAMNGLLALQLHAGEAMKVQFKNIRLKQMK